MNYNIETGTVQNVETDKRSEEKKTRQKRLKKIVLSLLGIALFFFLTTVYSQYQVYILKKLESSNAIAHPDIPVTPNQIVEAVAKHIILPDTAPQIASIQDAKKLSTSQAFFKDAVNGDVVLVYQTMIVIYRPTQDVLIAVGDISGASK